MCASSLLTGGWQRATYTAAGSLSTDGQQLPTRAWTRPAPCSPAPRSSAGCSVRAMTRRHDEIWVRPQLSLGRRVSIPRDRIPEHAVDPQTAYQLVHDELLLDGNARLNLATFVTTWMEPQARVLIQECLDKNLIDKDEYPQTAELERRCVEMLSSLWHAPGEPATGTSTTGSSEACMLGGLALLRRWQAKRTGGRPNLVMGANVQV